MSTNDIAPGEGFAVEAEPEETPFAMVGDWVLLAHIPDRAVRVYGLLRAHVNHARGDDAVWPSQEKLAAVLGLSKADDISKAIKILEGIGAVRKTSRTGRKGKYTVYIVRLHAPAGWTGMRSAAEDLHRKGAVEKLIAERVKRLPHRTQAAIEAAREGNTPNLGSPERSTPDLGATPDPVLKAPLDQGVKPYEGEPDEPTARKAAATRDRQAPVRDHASAAAAPATNGAELALIPPPSSAVATTPKVTGRDVASAWVDTYRTSVGAEPTRHQIGQVARESKALLEAGNRADRVLYAARSVASRGKALVTAEFADLSAAARGRSTARPAVRRSTTDERVSQGADLIAYYASLEAEEATSR